MKMTEKLDILMNKRGISRGELAKETSVPYTTLVGYYERGYQNAKLSNLRQIADFFNCSLDYLVLDEMDIDAVSTTTKKIPFEELDEDEIEAIKLLRQLPGRDKIMAVGELRRIVREYEAAETAKQISEELA